MTRKEQIEALEYIDSYINHYMNKLIQEVPYYYSEFGHMDKWQRNLEVWQKCLDYWKRRNNKILAGLMY